MQSHNQSQVRLAAGLTPAAIHLGLGTRFAPPALMQTRIPLPTRFELRYRGPDNLILVENYFNEVIIRATRDNFSDRRKLFFIRHLAAEGFIPARYQRIGSLAEPLEERVTWVID